MREKPEGEAVVEQEDAELAMLALQRHETLKRARTKLRFAVKMGALRGLSEEAREGAIEAHEELLDEQEEAMSNARYARRWSTAAARG